MSWTRIIFEHTVKTHAMPTEYADSIVDEYRAQGIGLHPGFTDNQILAVQIVTEWGFDMGGACIMGRPEEVFDVDGLAFSLPSDEIRSFYDYWTKEPKRIALNGLAYHKLKGTGCIIVRPTDYTKLLHYMWERVPAAEERSEAFLVEYTRTHAPITRGVTPEFAERLNKKFRRGN